MFSILCSDHWVARVDSRGRAEGMICSPPLAQALKCDHVSVSLLGFTIAATISFAPTVHRTSQLRFPNFSHHRHGGRIRHWTEVYRFDGGDHLVCACWPQRLVSDFAMIRQFTAALNLLSTCLNRLNAMRLYEIINQVIQAYFDRLVTVIRSRNESVDVSVIAVNSCLLIHAF